MNASQQSEIVRLYVEEELSTTLIGKAIGKNRKSVWLELRRAGVTLRNPGRVAKLPDIEELERLYVDERLTSVQIAKMFNCVPSSVIHQMRHYQVPTRPRGKGNKRDSSQCREIVNVETGEKCGKPVHKIRHAGNGALYGTRCLEHRKEHYRRLNREGSRKRFNRPPENWTFPNKFRWRDMWARRRRKSVSTNQVAPIEAVVSTRCQTRACPFPVFRGGFCKPCLRMATQERSMVGGSIAPGDYIFGW
jgi:hypothetical protein